MRINFNKACFQYRKLISKVYKKALQVTENDMPGLVVTVTFTDMKNIRLLNNQYRKVDRATDVLSFPMLDIKVPQKVSEFGDEFAPDGTCYLGDVVICKKIAKQQAKQFGHSLKREMAFLALHGLLHLLGYDHIAPEEEVEMLSMANAVLDEMKISRGGKNV